MKKIAVLAVITLVFTTCFNSWQGDEGNLSIGIGGEDGPTNEINDIPIENFRHIITLSDGPGADQTMIIDGAGAVNFSVIPGFWTITITAYVTTGGDGARTIIGDEPISSGSVRVEIKPGPNDVVTIPMEWRRCTVNFVSGNEIEIPDQSILHGKKANRPQGLTKDGHTFEGWYTEESFEHKWDFDNNIVTQNITLYAKWKENLPGTFTVTFVSNGGTGVTDKVVAIGEKVSQPQDITKDDHTLEGWYTEESFEYKWDFDVDTISEATILYAKWTLNTYTVTFNANGGSPEPEPQDIAHGNKILQPSAMNKTNYTFGGWYKEGSLTNEWNFNIDTVTTDTSLYAKWTLNTYTVTFMDGGTTLSDLTQNNVPHGSTVGRPENDPTKTGYIFANWYSNSGLSTLFNFSTPITTNTTVYAKWNINIIDGVIYVASTDEWNIALNAIRNGGNDKNYLINVVGDFSIIGSTDVTFGSVSNVTVTLEGAGRTLSLSGSGNMLRLGSNQIVILRDLTLRGHNLNNTSLVYVQDGTFTMESGELSGNYARNSGGGGVYVNSGTFTMDGGKISNNATSTYNSGGGVYLNGGTFTMNGGEISANTTPDTGLANTSGAGVYVAAGTFTMNGGKISGNINSGWGGGGVNVVSDGYGNSGTFIMYGGEISGNSTNSIGGGVSISQNGNFTMHDGKISDNTASAGGGVYLTNGQSFIMYGGEISGNTASGSGHGGGVEVNTGTFTMYGGEISGNTAYRGGGVYLANAGTFRIVTGIIYGSNEADESLRNTVTDLGAALDTNNFNTAQYGTLSGNTWNRNGILDTTENTIRVEEGQLIMNNGQ
jgi:uncharacterized repeat protein (TIGR02543 family)